MKKLLLSLGTIAAIAAPISATIACSDDESSKSDGVSNIETNGDNTNGDDGGIDKNPNGNEEKNTKGEAGADGTNKETGVNVDGNKNNPKDNDGKIVGNQEASKHELMDEGFTKDPLIPNFNIADEEETKVTVNEYSIDGKKYDVTKEDELKAFVKDWTVSVNADIGISEQLETFRKMAAPSAKNIVVFSEINGDKITLDLKNETGASVTTLQPAPLETTIDKFAEKARTKFFTPGNRGFKNLYIDWETVHSFAAGTKITKVPAKKSDSINSILYTQANTLTNTIDTDHDIAYIQSSTAAYKRASQDFDLLPYAERNPNFPISAEFRPGDSVVFAFDRESDLASFTQRVRYLDTMASGHGFTRNPSDLKSTTSLKVQDGKIVGIENPIPGDTHQTYLYSLEVIAKNAVQLTFNSFMENNGFAKLGEAFIFNAFEDVNNDGRIDCDDVSVTNQFVIDLNRLSVNYLPYVKVETFISGYDEALSKLNKEK